jgi:hypothetical protein
MRAVLIVSLAVVTLAACAEREQTAKGVKSDAEAFQGTNHAQFTAPGWRPGDRASWESELKVRTMMGQNDYAKVP